MFRRLPRGALCQNGRDVRFILSPINACPNLLDDACIIVLMEQAAGIEPASAQMLVFILTVPTMPHSSSGAFQSLLMFTTHYQIEIALQPLRLHQGESPHGAI